MIKTDFNHENIELIVIKSGDPQPQEIDIRFQVLFLGEPGVGKWSLLKRLRGQKFGDPVPYQMTIDLCTLKFSTNGQEVFIKLIYFPGRDYLRIIHKMEWKIHGAFLVFDISNLQSTENLSAWIDNIDKDFEPPIPVLVIGNKIDLRTETSKFLNLEEGQILTDNLNKQRLKKQKMMYAETSAKENTNLELALQLLAYQMLSQLNKSII